MKIKALIHRNHLSLLACSKMAGIPYATLHNICSGVSHVSDCSYSTLKKLADVLGTSVDKLVDGSAGDMLSREQLDDAEAKEFNNIDRAIDAYNVNNANNVTEIVKTVRCEVFPSYLRSIYAPGLLYAYREMYGDQNWTPKEELISIVKEVVDTYYETLGIQTDADGNEYAEDEHAYTVDDYKQAAKSALNKLESIYLENALTVSETHIAAIASAEHIKTCILNKTSVLTADAITEYAGLFLFCNYLYIIYDITSINTAMKKAVEEDRDVLRSCRDFYSEISYAAPIILEESTFRIDDEMEYNIKTINETYFLYNSLYLRNVRDDANVEKARDLYGINQFFKGEASVIRNTLCEMCILCIIYRSLYVHQKCVLTIKGKNYMRKEIKVTYDVDNLDWKQIE